MRRPWVLWVIAACGLLFIAGVFAQWLVPASVCIWVGLPFGIVGGLLARAYTQSGR